MMMGWRFLVRRLWLKRRSQKLYEVEAIETWWNSLTRHRNPVSRRQEESKTLYRYVKVAVMSWQCPGEDEVDFECFCGSEGKGEVKGFLVSQSEIPRV